MIPDLAGHGSRAPVGYVDNEVEIETLRKQKGKTETKTLYMNEVFSGLMWGLAMVLPSLEVK